MYHVWLLAITNTGVVSENVIDVKLRMGMVSMVEALLQWYQSALTQVHYSKCGLRGEY